MLYPQTRTRSWRSALFGLGGAALLLTVWFAVEARHLRAEHAAAFALTRSAGTSFAYVCNIAAPALPYLSAALVPAALTVMAPCLLQMSIVLVTAVAGLQANGGLEGPQLWRHGLIFAAGFLGTYAVAALALGVAGAALAQYAFVLRALGGVLLLLLGLAVLRLVPRVANSCRGPRWLLMTGKASLRKPFGAGIAFAIYCVGCCGPYVSGLALLGAGSGSAAGGALLVLAFALLMGGLLLLPIVALAHSQRITRVLAARARLLAALSGTALIAMGAVLALEPLAVWLVLQ